ncbi:MAG TPA: hypothetical protein VKT33_09835 [Candidatus Angelobacter sp.]|nr:hypothetical protein [Candidatus Angelobacter sp.]
MPQQIPPQGKEPKATKDDTWGSSREGYEDRTHYRPIRSAPQKPRGNKSLRSLGGMMIVGAMFWGAYLYTSSLNVADNLRQHREPACVCGAGVLISLLGKYIRL